ncbi:hypothetical protein HKCCE2091_21575 [Rhodobacterales bacterium HKCCE2091]|nr:hypothetical protein [Rhodobacterales bacterium HKCCE2091]
MYTPLVIHLVAACGIAAAYGLWPSADVETWVELVCKAGLATCYGILAVAVMRHQKITEARTMLFLALFYSALLVSGFCKLVLFA